MIRKTLWTVAILLMVGQAPLLSHGQSIRPSTAQSHNTKPTAAPGMPVRPATVPGAEAAGPGSAPTAQNTATSSPAQTPAVGTGADSFATPHISIATPAPAPAPWPWQERIAWGANLVLAVLGYVGIMMGLSLLRKIERQARYSEETAQAATESAKAALELAQSMARAERPWILMSVRPSPNIENGFVVMANNRGRGPARIVSTVDEAISAIDEGHLPATPEFRNQPVAPADPMILLPGESTEIFSFSRADVKRMCDTEERLARVEKWEEKIFIYGKVAYRDLTARDDAAPFASSWFCWYIHGRQKSGMVMAGPPDYNRHS